jgi:hypothetical protein
MRPPRLSRRQILSGLIAATLPAPAYSAAIGDLLGLHKPNDSDPSNAKKKPPEKLVPGKQGLFPGGYSQRFEPVRGMIARGDYVAAIDAFVPNTAPAATPAADSAAKPADSKAAKGANYAKAQEPPAHRGGITSDAFLSNAELGLIEFEAGHLEEAVEHLKKAESSETRGRSVGNTIGRGFGWIGGKITGQNELSPYYPLDYEAVLELNYLALAHLLKGQPTCYNVARRCIDLQQEIKSKFEKEIADAKEKLAKQEADDAKKPLPKDQAAKDAQTAQAKSLNDFTGEFAAYDSYARRVPNAYVNPLGDYLAGLIQEIASREETALRDNSRIAYESAVTLCGHSPQLSAAVAAMKRSRVPAGERVVHVIVGEGFAPERRELVFVLALVGQLMPIRLPIFTPVESTVERIEVLAGTGRPVVLDPIGDFEAIRMRSQEDRIPLLTLEVTTSMMASYAEGKTAHKFGPIGDLLNGAREKAAHADTRSWLSLPRRFHVARIVLPAAATSLTLTSLGHAGQRLATERIAVPKGDSHTVIYARAVDDHLVAQSARRLWIDGKLEIETHG